MAKKTATKTTKKATVKAAAPKARTTRKKSAPKSSPPLHRVISAQERYHMIDEAAYYRAEKSGFQVDPHANWIAAEKEIDELLSKQNIKAG